jgi:hypothetical protein
MTGKSPRPGPVDYPVAFSAPSHSTAGQQQQLINPASSAAQHAEMAFGGEMAFHRIPALAGARGESSGESTKLVEAAESRFDFRSSMRLCGRIRHAKPSLDTQRIRYVA